MFCAHISYVQARFEDESKGTSRVVPIHPRTSGLISQSLEFQAQVTSLG
jgi:hypothetical protein